MSTTRTLLLAAGLGALTGMRSMSALAFLSGTLRQHPDRRNGQVVRLLSSRTTSNVLGVLAAGELAADKAPIVPDRTEPPALFGRLALGALCGYAVAEHLRGPKVAASLLGSAAALGSTYAAFNLRKGASNQTDAPDTLLGLAEDALVLLGGWLATTGVRSAKHHA